MLRREIRERRELLFRKKKEQSQNTLQERREHIKHAMDKGNPLPYDMRKGAKKMAEDISWGEQIDGVDDEYRRDPSASLKRFVKEIKLTLPNSQTVNRGSHDVKSIIQACKSTDVTDIVFLNETRGVPDSLIVSHMPHGPTAFFSLHNVVMRHDIGDKKHMSEQYPHLVFHEINSKVGRRVASILKHIFPVPKPESKRVVSFTNTSDFISFRQYTHKTGEGGEIELKELGPRFELRPYQIILGTLDMANSCDTEWALRSYTNKRKHILSEA
ncbi:Brix domain-containing protein [Aphelenchoides bicaudatus]|nr:Brix domain-containing protein [Aphelenchoides bicaudatus]